MMDYQLCACLQYIPTVPVAGVEEWSKAGEGAWDCAWGSIKAPLSQQTVALALNPSEHRSQHQARHAWAADALRVQGSLPAT